MDVELRHLRAFVAVHEEGTFTDAAILLGTSQAAVSRTVLSLERALGVPVLRRSSRSVALTDAGRRLLPEARTVLRAAERAVAAAAAGEGPLVLGHPWSALGRLTTPFVREWNARHPDAPLRVERHNDRSSGLDDAHVDAAVIRHRLESPAYRSVVVGSERRVAAIASDDPLAGREALTLADLLDRIVAVDRNTGTTRQELWFDAGHTSAPRLVGTGDVDEWLDRIAAGGVVGITAASTRHQYPRPGVSYLPLADVPPLEVRLVWHPAREHRLTGRLAEELHVAYGDRPL